VTALAKERTTATDALDDTLRKTPPPSVASMQMDACYRLEQLVRLLRNPEPARSLP
jgi:hypothetical protein